MSDQSVLLPKWFTQSQILSNSLYVLMSQNPSKGQGQQTKISDHAAHTAKLSFNWKLCGPVVKSEHVCVYTKSMHLQISISLIVSLFLKRAIYLGRTELKFYFWHCWELTENIAEKAWAAAALEVLLTSSHCVCVQWHHRVQSQSLFSAVLLYADTRTILFLLHYHRIVKQ